MFDWLFPPSRSYSEIKSSFKNKKCPHQWVPIYTIKNATEINTMTENVTEYKILEKCIICSEYRLVIHDVVNNKLTIVKATDETTVTD